MRHVLALPLLSGRVSETAVAGGLVPAPRLPERFQPGRVTAPERAVPVTAVALGADEEDLPAARPSTDDVSK
jgi:hypothetical protein